MKASEKGAFFRAQERREKWYNFRFRLLYHKRKEIRECGKMTKEALEARKSYSREYRERNRERINQRQREWRARNPERLKKLKEQYWEKKAQAIRAAESPALDG